jgi:hypothetical protein
MFYLVVESLAAFKADVDRFIRKAVQPRRRAV